jgi:hypothetical protein
MLSSQTKLMRSEDMTQAADAGGRMTGTQIQSGAVSNLFDVISEVGHAVGQADLVKVFAFVDTADTQIFKGAHIIVSKPPTDPKVFWALMTTEDWFDHRADAQNYVESYFAKATRFDGYVDGRQYAGMSSITLWQRPDRETPKIGYVYAVSEISGAGAVAHEQYVKFLSVSSSLHTVSSQSGSFVVRRSVCEISTALRAEYTGQGETIYDPSPATLATDFSETRAVDAARYYSCSPLAAPVALGDLSLTVDSIFVPIVPAAVSELALTDIDASGNARALVQSGGAPLTLTTSTAIAPGSLLYFGGAFWPGSLSLVAGATTITDSGGQLYIGATAIGTANYASGILQFAANAPTLTGAKNLTALPAASPTTPNETYAQAVTQGNNGLVWAVNLTPIPQPGTLRVSYRSGGVWYTLIDNGRGELRGATSAYGVAALNFSTGSATLNAGALPDIGTKIIWQWATKADYFDRSGVAVAGAKIAGQCAQEGVDPAAFSISWPVGAATKTATANASGVLSGDGTGQIRPDGAWELTPALLPNLGATFAYAYNYGPLSSESGLVVSDAPGHAISIVLAATDLSSGSVTVTVSGTVSYSIGEYSAGGYVSAGGTKQIALTLHDDGAGGWRGGIVGSINYAAGTATATIPLGQVSAESYIYATYEPAPGAIILYLKLAGKAWVALTDANAILQGGNWSVGATYRAAAAATAANETLTISGLSVDLTPQFAEQIVPDALAFALGGHEFRLVSGILYRDIDAGTGVGTQAGAVSLATGDATLTSWTPGAPNAVTLRSLVTVVGLHPVSSVVTRLDATDLTPGLTSTRATLLDGTSVSATVNESGLFVGPHIRGEVDATNGIISVQFGAWVAAAGNESQPWYDAGAVVGGQIFRPEAVDVSTVRHNAVAKVTLPLDADIVGLDPVRLPSDGHVPWVRKSDLIVPHHTSSLTLPNPPVAATQYSVGRVRIGRARLFDANQAEWPIVYGGRDPVHGTLLDRDGQSAAANARAQNLNEDQVLALIGPMALPNTVWVFDLAAGHLETPANMSLAGMVLPLRVEHTIEDMRLVNGVDISGRLTVTEPFSHAFPVGTIVSSALHIGDMQARYTEPFSQQTWTGAWSDALVGAGIGAQYDDLNYPIVVSNKGAQQERWRIEFQTSTTYKIVGEKTGQIASGLSMAEDQSPINPATGAPYFTVKALGFGGGWSAGNVLRFNTSAANFPVWAVRAVMQGAATVTSDGGEIYLRGGARVISS